MDTLVNFYPTVGTFCVVLSSSIGACAACAGAWRVFKIITSIRSERDAEIDKQIAKLETAMQIKHRCDRRMSQNCQRLERRVKQLEKTNKGEKQ